MFEIISCYISGDRVEVNGQSFLLGELTTDLLGIRPDEFEEMYAVTRQLEECLKSPQPEDHLFELRTEMNVLRRMLIRYKLFRALESRVPEFMEEDELTVLSSAKKCVELVGDLYTFNQTMFYFIDRYIMHLKKLDAENYAAALFDYFSDPRADKRIVNPIRNPGLSFTTHDWMQVQFVPREIPDKKDEYAIYEYYHLEQLQSFLKLDFYRALMASRTIRRCKNCRLFFLLTKGHHTDYCDRPLPNRPHRNCRNQAFMNHAKEKAKNNPVLRSYENACQRVRKDCDRGRITDADKKLATRQLRDLRDEAVSGKHRDAEVDALMQSKALYAALGIVRQGGR